MHMYRVESSDGKVRIIPAANKAQAERQIGRMLARDYENVVVVSVRPNPRERGRTMYCPF